MIDLSELAAVPVLSGVSAEDLLRIAQTAADMRLASGEYAVHEGDERALFVVLGGRHRGDQVDRRHRADDRLARAAADLRRGPDRSSAPRSRAATAPTSRSRVVRIEPTEFHALAARSPDTLTRVATLARERIGGLQGIATAPTRSRATLVGQRGDPACRELRTFLARNQIRFEWLTPDPADGGPVAGLAGRTGRAPCPAL